MPPNTNFGIKQNTPEADKLEGRLHEQLKEIWDPTADATVARYLTAMLAKGYDRKKIHAQLKAILQESVTVQLLDWLYKHLRLHGSEYQSEEAPASSKPASKPPASATKVLPTEEVELRLEDLEAQQLEGSDLEDDAEVNDTVAVPASTAAEAPGPSSRHETAQLQHQDRAVSEPKRPPEPAGRAAQAPAPVSDDRNGLGASRATSKPERSERRHREPIPIPNFTEAPRSRSGGGNGPAAKQPAPVGDGAADRETPQSAIAPEQPPERQPPPPQQRRQQEARERREQQQHLQPVQQHQQPPLAPAGERRRLKSSVVLDWESWHKQKQPDDEGGDSKSAAPSGKPAVQERVPVLPRVTKEEADELLTSQRDRDAIRDRERDRERDRDRGAGMGRRRQPTEAEVDRPGPRHRDGDGDASARRGHDRESDGAGRRSRGGEAAHRSRSRSRSPRGRRPGRAPLGTANLLRSALREVDGLAAGPAAASARGGKPSVFERLGASGGAAEAVPARAPVLQRLAGTEKADKTAMDTTGSGRKRGPEEDGNGDAAILGSPPKAARGPLAQKPAPGDEPAAAGRARAGPATGRQRLEFSPAAATTAGAGTRHSGPQNGDSEIGPSTGQGGTAGKQAAVTSAAAPAAGGVEGGADPKAAELELLRQQMAAMQEKLARMEAAKELSPPPQVPPPQVPQPQPQVRPQLQMPPLLPSQPPRQPQGQMRPQLESQLQVQPQGQAQPQQRPQLQPPLSQPPPQQQLQELPIAARLQPRVVAPPPGAGMGGRPAGGMAMPSEALAMGSGTGGGARGATIMPTSMSGVVIEGGSGSPPRRPPVQQQPQQPEPPPPKADQQRLAAAQLEADLRSVVVENVHFLASKDVLAAHFSVVGPVKNVTIVQDRFTGRPTGVAVVEMGNEQATQAAAALTGSLLMDMPILVTLKAALLLQGMNLGVDPAGAGAPPLLPSVGAGLAGVAPGGRLNPAAAPFVPGLAAMGAALGAGGGRGAVRPPPGALGSAGRQPWVMGAGGRGRGSNVWVREAARPANPVGSNVGERS